jgi:hypothetical protein
MKVAMMHGALYGIAKFRNPKRVTCSAKAPQHVAVLVACLGDGKRRQGKGGHAWIHDGRDRDPRTPKTL